MRSIVLMSLVMLIGLAGTVFGQDDPAAPTPADPKPEAPAPEQPEEPADAPEPEAPSGPEAIIADATALLEEFGDIRPLYDELQELGVVIQRFGEFTPPSVGRRYNQVVDLIAEFETRSVAVEAATDEAAAANPDHTELIRAKAKVKQFLQKDKAALAALESLGENAGAEDRYTMAGLYLKRNRYHDAIKACDAILKETAGHAKALAIRAQSKFATHDFSGALADYKKADEIKDGDHQLSEAGRIQNKTTSIPTAKRYVDLWVQETEIRKAEAEADDLPRVKFKTSRGEIVIELFENEAPNTVANFIYLVSSGFFDGSRFHRVINNFMVQGGDPLSKNDIPEDDGSGGPGYAFADELGEDVPWRKHFRGSLSMANSGPNTNGSQFFLTHLPTDWLNGRHTVVGRILEGQDVVDAIEAGDTLESAEVLRKRDHDYVPVGMDGNPVKIKEIKSPFDPKPKDGEGEQSTDESGDQSEAAADDQAEPEDEQKSGE